MRFPEEFWWGASTAAYQIEGDNRGSAFWDWEVKKGWERSGHACNSWKQWRDDIRALKELNLNAYRFSVEWSRVEPEPDRFDEAALERYAEQASAIARARIRPIACLHHFSEPAWLAKAAPLGWHSEETLKRFLRFTARVSGALKPWVREWITFNEPMVFLMMGYAAAHFPPGRFGLPWLERDFLGRGGLIDRIARAHASAGKIIKEDRPDARVGLAQNIVDVEPARTTAADMEAARDWDSFMHRRLLDLCASSQSLDFLGINYYTRILVSRLRLPGAPLRTFPAYAEVEAALGRWLFRALGGRRGDRPRTDMGWEIVPEGLEQVVKRYWQTYHLPIVITENGLADSDGSRREAYLRDHLAALGRAMASGSRVWGYLHWTLVDNYEWGSYRPKFGLFNLDRRNNYARVPAAGAAFYAQVARTGELPEPAVTR